MVFNCSANKTYSNCVSCSIEIWVCECRQKHLNGLGLKKKSKVKSGKGTYGKNYTSTKEVMFVCVNISKTTKKTWWNERKV